MSKLYFILIFFIGLQLAGIESNEPLHSFQILTEKQLFETEFHLAKSGKLYFIFNLPEKKIYLKSRGVVLRDWQIISCHYWGNELTVKRFQLIKKSSFQNPKREKIVPMKKIVEITNNQNAKNKIKSNPKLKALELSDMPSVYSLILEGNIHIYIRKKSESVISQLDDFRLSIRWNTFPPLLTLWYSVKSMPFTALDIVLNREEDAQSLYWAFTEDCPTIIIPIKEYYEPFPPAI